MKTIIDIISSLNKDFSNLIPNLKDVRLLLSAAKADIAINGKLLRRANVEHASVYAYYDEIRVYLQSLYNYSEIRISERRAQVIKMISEESSYDYGERLKEKLAEEDPSLIELKLHQLEIDEVLGLSKSICESMKQRGYSLKNISNLIVAQSQDDQLIMNSSDD